MLTTHAEIQALQRIADLEPWLEAVESRLAALDDALVRNDPQAIEITATELQRALATAVDHFTRAARAGRVPAPLRHRLAVAGGQVAAQREALARATAALDRAIDVLLPTPAPRVATYSAAGQADGRSGHLGSLLA